MKIKLFRIFMLAELILIVISGQTSIAFYWLIFMASTEFLNRKAPYLNSSYKVWNLVYLLYIVFITLERGRNSFLYLLSDVSANLRFSENIEALLNIAEHFSFALIICSQLYFYTLIFSGRQKSLKTLNLIIILIFNVIGLVNELFQNFMGGNNLFWLSAEAFKDILVNLVGSLIFVILSMFILENKVENSVKAN